MTDYMKDIYKTLNVLCVDDDENVLNIYNNLFSIMFKKVYCARDGEDGLDIFKNNKIDIVLTDYKMPKSNGLDMSRKIRQLNENTPIIMVTALENLSMLREALDINITGFLKKPITSASLNKVFSLAVKSIIAQNMMNEENHLFFEKEKLIAQEINDTKLCDIKTSFIPSGNFSVDSFVIKDLEDGSFFIFMIDGETKSIPNSVTSMLASSFINYHINSLKYHEKKFDLYELLKEFIIYISPNIFDKDRLAMSFLHIDNSCLKIDYSIFAMSDILYKKDEKILRLKANNEFLTKNLQTYNVNSVNINGIEKMLIYSKGFIENQIKDRTKQYVNFIFDDFLNSKDSSEFEKLYLSRVDDFENDVTYIYLKH